MKNIFTILLWLCIASPVVAKPKQPVKPVTNTLTGSLSLSDRKIGMSDDGCYGTGGYSDLPPQASVIILNEQQNIIAKGVSKSIYKDFMCNYFFNVPNIPKAEFYTVQIGNRKIVYSHAELVNGNWSIQLTLGE